MHKKAFLTFPVLCIIFLSSCRKADQEGGITSGIIEYNIRYLNDNLDGKLEELLPRSMKMIFDQEQAINNIDGFLGMYRLNTVTDFTNRKCSTQLKVFDKKYLYRGKRGEIMCCFDGMEGMEIVETGETRTIAGLECRHAIATFPSGNKSFDIYYTQDIALRNPNLNNPYKKIDGVLIQFELQFFHLRMEFIADKFTLLTGRQSRLTDPGSGTEITREQMSQVLLKLLE